jgi:hypothetical protein
MLRSGGEGRFAANAAFGPETQFVYSLLDRMRGGVVKGMAGGARWSGSGTVPPLGRARIPTGALFALRAKGPAIDGLTGFPDACSPP